MSESAEVSSLFRFIETLQGAHAWGSFLDAGTGAASLRWLTGLPTSRWTAVTASERMAAQSRDAVPGGLRKQDRIVVGNWTDNQLLHGEVFDTVLLDYLIGAIEGFAPYWQEMVFDRLRPHVGGRIYVTGVEPYVPFPAPTEAGKMVREIGCLRDACLLLAGERPYREFPIQWVLRKMASSGFNIIEAKHFPIILRERFINAQLDMCRDRLQRFGAPALSDTMLDHVESVRQRALTLCAREDGLSHGADYVIAAEPA